MTFNFDFPSSPNVIAEWKAVQLEPIINSGEKVTVIILLRDSFANVTIHKAIEEKIIEQLFQQNSNNIIGLINYLEKSFMDKSFDDWKSPFEGVYTTHWVKAIDFTLDGILKQALLQSSCLHDFGKNIIKEHQDKKETNSWNSDILALTTAKNSQLKNFFNKKIELRSNIKYEYDFAYQDYVSNFIDFTKLKGSSFQKPIFNLQLLKDSHTIQRHTEIILHIPSQEDINSMSLSKYTELSEKIQLIQLSLERNNISLFKAESAEIASDRILNMVA